MINRQLTRGRKALLRTKAQAVKAQSKQLEGHEIFQHASSMQKALMQVDQDTRMAIEDINDGTYMASHGDSATNAFSVQGYNNDYTDVTKKMQRAIECVQEAMQCYSDIKSAIRDHWDDNGLTSNFS